MTENEIIERLKYFTQLWEDNKDVNDAMVVEVDKEFMACIYSSIDALSELQQYHSIGTVDECREAAERQRAKKPIAKNEDRKIYMCQCGNTQINAMDNFCGICGQAIELNK